MFLIIFILTLALDQVSKYLVASEMLEGQTVPFINGIFDITYVKNTGAAFNIFDEKPVLLFVITGCLLLLLFVYVIKEKSKLSVLEKISLSMITSGGLGNIITRAVYSFVIDFFNFYFWPVFNVADVFICIGCGLLILYVFLIDNKKN